MVHGTRNTVNNILAHPEIKAVSFVGSDNAGRYLYEHGSLHGKRVQSNMGAKNHAVVLPDADVDSTVKALTGGMAGRNLLAYFPHRFCLVEC